MGLGLCQARSRGGERCRKPVVPGKRVCRHHGGLSPGAYIPWARQHSQRAGIAARFERLREARAAGLIEKLPGRPRGLKRQVEDMAKAVAEVRVPEASSLGEKLTGLTSDSLDVMSEIVRRKKPYSDRAHKLKALQKDTAIAAVNAQLRVDENVLRARQQGERLAPVLGALLAAAGEEHDPAGLAVPARDPGLEPVEETGFPAGAEKK